MLWLQIEFKIYLETKPNVQKESNTLVRKKRNKILKRKKQLNIKHDWTVMEILTCFCCLLRNGFFQIMCIASFKLNLNGVEPDSIISK